MKTFKEIRKGYHRMPDGSIMKDSDHPKGAKKENMSLAPKGKGREAAKKLYKDEKEIDELSIAQQQQRRRNRKNASLQKAMAKYRDCILNTSPSQRDATLSRMPSSG